MKLKRIRQILTICFFMILVLGSISFFSIKKKTKKIENQKIDAIETEYLESQKEEEAGIEKKDLSTYFGHSRKEIEEVLGESLIQLNLNGQTIGANGTSQDFFLFFEEDVVKAALLVKENDSFQIDGMKIGDLISEIKGHLDEEYDYKSCFLEGNKLDMYEKKEGNFFINLEYADKKVTSLFACEKEYEDSIFKFIINMLNANGNSQFTGYILEDSDKQYIEIQQLQGLAERELILAEKEIYARYGAVFDEENIQIVFNRTEWYVPKDVTEKEVEKQLNQYEKENIKRIEKVLEEKADS